MEIIPCEITNSCSVYLKKKNKTSILKIPLYRNKTNTVFPRLSPWSRMSAGIKEDITITSAPENESNERRDTEILKLIGGTHLGKYDISGWDAVNFFLPQTVCTVDK